MSQLWLGEPPWQSADQQPGREPGWWVNQNTWGSTSKEHHSEGRVGSLKSYQQRNECWKPLPPFSFLRNKSFTELTVSSLMSPMRSVSKQTSLLVGARPEEGFWLRGAAVIVFYVPSLLLWTHCASSFQHGDQQTPLTNLTPSHCLEWDPPEPYLDF